MKIAVASNGDNSISPHFGRSAAWLVFDVQDGTVVSTETRPNRHSHHAINGGHANDGGAHSHSHSAIVSALADCEVVICAGMGWRAAEDLKKHGIEPYVTDHSRTAEEAVALFSSGQLTKFEQSFCRGRH